MGGRSEVPPDDRGLENDVTSQAAHRDSKVAEALSLMRSKLSDLDRKEQSSVSNEKDIGELKTLEKQVGDLLNPLHHVGDPQSAKLFEEVSKIFTDHDLGKINDETYAGKLRAFLRKLMEIE